MFIATLFIKARTWKKHRCSSTDEWIEKFWYIYQNFFIYHGMVYVYMVYVHIYIYTYNTTQPYKLNLSQF